jgi:hypothetical protein
MNNDCRAILIYQKIKTGLTNPVLTAMLPGKY